MREIDGVPSMKIVWLILLLIAASCKGKKSEILSENSKPLKMCAAVRGNGELVLAHFSSLSKVVGKLGLIDGFAGGSSASITAFIYESMLQNPFLSANESKKQKEVALLLKSVYGFVEYVEGTPEAQAIFQLKEYLSGEEKKRLQAGLAKSDKQSLDEVRSLLKKVTELESLQDLINPAFLKLLFPTGNIEVDKQRLQEAYKSVTAVGGAFAVPSDSSLFLRPGLLDFKKVASRLNYVAHFYAGLGNMKFGKMKDYSRNFETFLNECSDSVDTGWNNLNQKCHQTFKAAVTQYFLADEKDSKKRTSDLMGSGLPVLISTSVLSGDAFKKYSHAKSKYENGKLEDLSALSKLDFSKDVGFGYWGNSRDLKSVLKKQDAGDLKSALSRALPEASWGEALSASPAEPGLSNGVKLNENTVSLGGWSDLHPVKVLKDIGCEKVIYITRNSPESQFAVGTARQLGATDKHIADLYSLDNKGSSFSKALVMADGVWCTDWNNPQFGAQNRDALDKDSFSAPLVTDNKAWLTEYSGSVTVQSALGKPQFLGCVGN